MSLDQSANGTLPPPDPARPERQDNVPAAIFLMLGATFVFTCTSALSKWLIETYPIGEVLFSRVFVPLIGLAIIILPRTGLAVFRTTRLKGHLLRGASQSCSQTFLMIAFSLMPLASAVAINFSAPIFATLASIILLREYGRHRALVGDPGRLLRRADRDQPGHRHVHDRRAVRAGERGDVRHRDRGRARADRDRVRPTRSRSTRC